MYDRKYLSHLGSCSVATRPYIVVRCIFDNCLHSCFKPILQLVFRFFFSFGFIHRRYGPMLLAVILMKTQLLFCQLHFCFLIQFSARLFNRRHHHLHLVPYTLSLSARAHYSRCISISTFMCNLSMYNLCMMNCIRVHTTNESTTSFKRPNTLYASNLCRDDASNRIECWQSLFDLSIHSFNGRVSF